MLVVVESSQFKKSFKKVKKHKDFKIFEFQYVLNKLRNLEELEQKYKVHSLSGKYKGYKECHIQNDILLVFSIEEEILVLYVADIGSHSDLFK